MRMSAEIFDQVLRQQTRLSERTLEAARAVLVDGATQSHAAREMGMQRQAVQRGVARVLEVAEAIGLPVMTGLQMVSPLLVQQVERAANASRVAVINSAREAFGDGVEIQDARPGCKYEGRVELRTPQHIIQNTGPASFVVHDLTKLERVPQIGAGLIATIRYPDDGMASVVEKEPSMSRSRGGISF